MAFLVVSPNNSPQMFITSCMQCCLPPPVHPGSVTQSRPATCFTTLVGGVFSFFKYKFIRLDVIFTFLGGGIVFML